ncbi:Predicted Zn-dependent protease or its inactivated homolog [Micromonospora sediminimaris]|uniref:Peptidase n=1 Tax=Micromonospora sediminimaris TaxID=547162 RepID=A0A9W5UWW5_9ACTN|nr:peptidase [Micromonospora sediminimaris]SFD50517.1 Predicted Zn-dependent protease or its inactivated homolog [Micromonospora sediminimaris]
MNTPGPQETIELALTAARGDATVVIVESGVDRYLRWADSTLVAAGDADEYRLSVVSVVGGRVGAVSVSGRVGRAEIVDAVDGAEAVARQAPPAPDARPLPEPGAASPCWDDPVRPPAPGVLAGLVEQLSTGFARAARHGQVLHGYAEHGSRTTFLGTSAGARLRHDGSAGHLELTARDGRGAPVWTSAVTDDFTDVSVAGLQDDLDRRLRWERRRVDLPPGRYECLVPPSAVADMMNYAYTTAGAAAAAQGRTAYSRAGGRTRIGETIAGIPLTLRSDPTAEGLRCAPFLVATASSGARSVFDNGLALGPTRWWEQGRLRSLVHTRHSAEELGMPLTPLVENLILEGPPGGGAEADLVARTRRGLLLTSLWYIREVDLATMALTGVTRDGVYLVEDGEVVGAVHNFRFNDSPLAMVMRATEVGRTVPTRARDWGDAVAHVAMPMLRVPDFPLTAATGAV